MNDARIEVLQARVRSGAADLDDVRELLALQSLSRGNATREEARLVALARQREARRHAALARRQETLAARAAEREAERVADAESKRAELEERRRIAAAAREIEEALRREDRARELLDHPEVVRLRAMLRTPLYAYDASEETQCTVVECIDAIPERLRRVAFSLPRHRDPLSPVVDAIIDVAGWQESTLHLIGWIYGVSRERIRQIQSRAESSLRRNPEFKRMRCYLEKDPCAQSTICRENHR